MAARVWIGVDIGGTKTAIVLSAKPPAIQSRIEFPTIPAKGPERALGLIRDSIGELLRSERLKISALRGIGISCGSPLDRVGGIIQAPPNLSTWIDVPIKAIIEEQFDTGCRVENDANAGAVAEHRYGAGRGCDHMIFLTMGTGFGAGIIIGRRLYRGTTGSAGEIGHVRLTRSGPVGYHKTGSVEGWVSGGGIAQVARRAVCEARRQRIKTTLAKPLQDGLTARDVAIAAAKGDAVAIQVIRFNGRTAGRGTGYPGGYPESAKDSHWRSGSAPRRSYSGAGSRSHAARSPGFRCGMLRGRAGRAGRAHRRHRIVVRRYWIVNGDCERPTPRAVAVATRVRRWG